MTKHYRFLIYLVLSLFLIFGSREVRYRKAEFIGKYLYFPFVSSVNWIESQLQLKSENWKLHNQIARYQQELNRIDLELDFYRKQNLEFQAPVYEHLTADVIGATGNYGQRYFILDKGSSSGIETNMPVLGKDGIIGKIVRNSLNYSLLMPFSHSDFKLGVMLKKNYLHGLLEADLEGNISMNMVTAGSEISLGDTLVTSHFSTTFPAFYPVGTISRLRMAQDKLNLSAEVKPFSDLQSMTTVIILKYKNEFEYQKELGIGEKDSN